MSTNRVCKLVKRPVPGLVKPDIFAIEDQPLREPGPGEFEPERRDFLCFKWGSVVRRICWDGNSIERSEQWVERDDFIRFGHSIPCFSVCRGWFLNGDRRIHGFRRECG